MPWGGWPDPRRDEDEWYPDVHDVSRATSRPKNADAYNRPYHEKFLLLERKLRMWVDKRRIVENEKESH